MTSTAWSVFRIRLESETPITSSYSVEMMASSEKPIGACLFKFQVAYLIIAFLTSYIFLFTDNATRPIFHWNPERELPSSATYLRWIAM
ncbi:hypothetical protein Patl1_18282 [Pistacia atlantica]|uniref:Uncharacterized protein n=1 Tax=Pistacia atlantica TaxID=434234 RepID=A0ACC1C398_9ROSI|nr:hypothetical protein Patl1_18282 [Pistacia atlantica]